MAAQAGQARKRKQGRGKQEASKKRRKRGEGKQKEPEGIRGRTLLREAVQDHVAPFPVIIPAYGPPTSAPS